MNEEKLRQRSLLDDRDGKPLPKEVEAKALELLAQLLIALIPTINGEERDEQDQK